MPHPPLVWVLRDGMLTGDSYSDVGPSFCAALRCPDAGPKEWPLHLTALHPDVGPALRCVYECRDPWLALVQPCNSRHS